MVSGNIDEVRPGGMEGDDHDAFVTKPVDMRRLLDRIRALTGLDWLIDTGEPRAAAEAQPEPEPDPVPTPAASHPLPEHHRAELRQLAHIGYVRGIEAKLGQIAAEPDLSVEARASLASLRAALARFDLKRIQALLDNAQPAQEDAAE
jgi:hypothetical protein